MFLRLYLAAGFFVVHSRLFTDTATQSLGALNKVIREGGVWTEEGREERREQNTGVSPMSLRLYLVARFFAWSQTPLHRVLVL